MTERQLARLRAAHLKVAQLVQDNRAYLPIFRRLDAELTAEEARLSGNAVAYARAAMAAQNACTTQS